MKQILHIAILMNAWGVIPYIASAACQSPRGGHCAELGAIGVSHQFAQIPKDLQFLQLNSLTFGDVLVGLYTFGLSIVGISAFVMITIGGVQYMTSAGNPGAMSNAKEKINNAFLGMAVALLAWMLLYTINPDFVTKLDLSASLPKIGAPTSDVPPPF